MMRPPESMTSTSLPSISVVIAAYNAAATLDTAIRSALDQDIPVHHVIVCDDASVDGTAGLVALYQDPRVVLLENETNLGPGQSRDRAIQLVTSDWVAILDADDSMSSSRLGELLSATTSCEADVAFDDPVLCHETAAGLAPWRRIHGDRAFGGRGHAPRTVRTEDYIFSPRLLVQPIIRTAFLRAHGINHSSRRFAEDAEFYLRLAHAGARFCYVPQPLYLYRITPGSLTDQARDPSLMRQCLEECAQWEGWSPSARAAFDIKIASLHRNEAAYALARLVRSGRMAAAARLLTSQPHLLRSLPPKLLERVGYHAHRLLHGGRRR